MFDDDGVTDDTVLYSWLREHKSIASACIVTANALFFLFLFPFLLLPHIPLSRRILRALLLRGNKRDRLETSTKR